MINETTDGLRYEIDKQILQNIVNVCDKDASGGCTIDEIAQMILDHFPLFFDLIDTNNDG